MESNGDGHETVNEGNKMLNSPSAHTAHLSGTNSVGSLTASSSTSASVENIARDTVKKTYETLWKCASILYSSRN